MTSSHMLNNIGFSAHWESESFTAEIIVTKQKFSARSNCLCIHVTRTQKKQLISSQLSNIPNERCLGGLGRWQNTVEGWFTLGLALNFHTQVFVCTITTSCFEMYSPLWKRDLQWLTNYLRLTLVFICNTAQRERFFKSFLQVLRKRSFWPGDWVLGFLWSLNIFLIFPNLLRS